MSTQRKNITYSLRTEFVRKHLTARNNFLLSTNITAGRKPNNYVSTLFLHISHIKECRIYTYIHPYIHIYRNKLQILRAYVVVRLSTCGNTLTFAYFHYVLFPSYLKFYREHFRWLASHETDSIFNHVLQFFQCFFLRTVFFPVNYKTSYPPFPVFGGCSVYYFHLLSLPTPTFHTTTQSPVNTSRQQRKK